MATNGTYAQPNGKQQSTKSEKAEQAVFYGPATDEHKILTGKLQEPAPRARRADAHRPSPRERFRTAATDKVSALAAIRAAELSFKFRYSELGEEEIRILRLYKNKHQDDPLRADLFNRKLDDVKGGYEALSYCWGSEHETHVIQIRDLNATGPVQDPKKALKEVSSLSIADVWRTAVGAITHTDFKIRKNLYQALKRLRSRYRDVYLWVDAICINQSEDGAAEKARQLAMMARIYNSAANVCVWLGEDYDSERAKSAFQLVGTIMNYQNFDGMVRDVSKMSAWSQLISIMKADWFSRRWIIQEIALSREASIHCGENNVHWDDFTDAISLLIEKIDLMRTEFKADGLEDVESTSAAVLIQTLGNICRKSDYAEDKGTLNSRLLDVETLVSTLLGFQATFPRDTIYSILSLAKDPPLQYEEWQKIHKHQLEQSRREKLARIADYSRELEETKTRLEAALEKEKPIQERRKVKLEKLEEYRQLRREARSKGRDNEVLKLTKMIRDMHEGELEEQDARFKLLESDVNRYAKKIRQQSKEQDRTLQEKPAIGLLPNYKFSPRDLFIAFVTRSIYQSKSLDIICRHWAPELAPEDGGDQLPSWVSSLNKAPYGVPGAAQGRQNGENLVAYLPHDQRKRYSASGTSKAEIQMEIDPLLSQYESLSKKSMTQEESKSSQEEPSRPQDHSGTDGAPQTEPQAPGLTTSDQATSSGAARLDSSPLGRSASDFGGNNHANGAGGSIWPGVLRSVVGAGATAPRSHPQTPDSARSDHEPGVPEETPDEIPAATSPLTHYPPADSAVEDPPETTDADAADAAGAADPSTQLPPHQLRYRGKPPERPRRMSTFPEQSPPAPEPARARQHDSTPISFHTTHRLSGILVVTGFILGTIAAQSDVMRGGVIPGNWVSKLGWEKRKNNENRVPDTLWRLLVADRMPQGARPPQWYKRACLHGLVDPLLSDNAGNIHPVTPSDRKISELTTKYFKRVESVVWNRRIFELEWSSDMYSDEDSELGDGEEEEKRYRPLYGLCPEGSQVGDLVCILYGCSVPVVLKKVPDEDEPRVSDLFEVVGETYVHGVMDGEAMPEQKTEGTKRKRKFKLG